MNAMQRQYLFRVEAECLLPNLISAWSKGLVSVDREHRRIVAWADPLSVQQFCTFNEVEVMPLDSPTSPGSNALM